MGALRFNGTRAAAVAGGPAAARADPQRRRGRAGGGTGRCRTGLHTLLHG
jgi:hypothetical protein